MKSILILAFLATIFCRIESTSEFLLGPLNDYQFCNVVDEAERVVLFWKIAGVNLEFAVVGNTTGYVSLGIHRAGARTDQMTNSDSIVGWVTDATSIADVDDYFIGQYQSECGVGVQGVCRDTDIGGAKSITATSATQDSVNGVTTIKFTRSAVTTDANFDANIDNSVQNFIWAIGSTDLLSYHDAKGSFSLNLYSPSACPTNPNDGTICSSHGTCIKGCCVCNIGFGKRDCSLDLGYAYVSSLSPDIIETEYSFSRELSSEFKVFWKVFEVDQTIEFAVRVKGTGWIAFGPSKSGQMTDSDVILGTIRNGNVEIDDYFLNGRNGGCPGVCKDVNSVIGGKNNILDYNGNEKNGVTELKWIRPLRTGDATGDIDIVSGPLNVVWGFHPTSKDLAKHTLTTRGSVVIDFFSGTVSKNVLHLIHGILMFIGWAVLIPAGSFVARFFKKFSWWFHAHRILNGVAVGGIIAGFIISIIMVGSHFETPHAIIGLVVVIVGFAQPIIGVVADKLYDTNRLQAPILPDKLHWVLGWTSLLLGMINIFLGIILYDDQGILIGYGIYFAIIIAFISGYMIFKGIVGADDDH